MIANYLFSLNILVRPGRLERPTCGFEVRRSIQLSYGRLFYIIIFIYKIM